MQMTEAVVIAVAVLVGALVLVPLILVVRDTVRKSGRWGLNVASVTQRNGCPRCGRAIPALRAPKSVRQALWGGWTCEGCGLELDKWGRPVE